MSKHTPGPWIYDEGANFVCTPEVYIATIEIQEPPEAEDEPITLANGNLIAKAPEMYELLKDAVQQWASMIDNEEPITGSDAVEWLVDFITDVREVIEPV